ncbi:C6 zinc finger protein [Amylocarpus encephaloides]|uniref:C6 zinc finger protein n=1 Tax=Amylocarpus encephaloides TaxID=45428 RepID=A0A9P7YA90_9HELO|nr:C6 zinc finger protein [Amylocarpus encephaloides]
MPPSTQNDTGFGLPARKLSRKSHRKSRNGCQNCKRRKIKCDEQKPQCANCNRHSTLCRYPHVSTPSLSTLPEPPQGLPSHLQPALSYRQPLNVRDMELLHHYHISTSYTLANDSGLQACFRITVPQIGVSYPFVLHGILSLASLHLSRFKRDDVKAHYVAQSQYHYETALRAASSLMSNISEETCPALYLSTIFCCHITLGLGPRPGDFLVFGEEGLPEWLVMFRAMKTIVSSCYEPLRNSDLAPMFQIQNLHVDQPEVNDRHLKSLHDMILSATPHDPDQQLYLTAVSALARSFPTPSSTSVGRTTQSSPQLVFAWLYRLSDEFVLRLQQRNPISLVILAHFCVLFNSLSSFWWSKDWVDHLMKEIYDSLPREHRLWIKWPMEEIGWIPN